MAIVTTPIDDPLPGVYAPRRRITTTRLVKQDIVRQGITGWSNIIRQRNRRHDPKTAPQIACRAPMRFARVYYYAPFWIDRPEWNAVHPQDFFCDSVKRWLADDGPARHPGEIALNPGEEITELTAVGSKSGILLTFSADEDATNWGVAILRSPQEIVTPLPRMLRIIFPVNTVTNINWLDTEAAPGTWHYRLSTITMSGGRGPFSNDVSATRP